jgi:formate hydrogenlyase transcriptional activator
MDRSSASPCETLAEQYQSLLEVAEAISAHRDLHELFRDLAQRLPQVVHVNFVALSVHDPERNMMRLHTIQANVPADLVGGHEEPVDETPAGLVWQTQQLLLVPDLAEEHRWPKVTQRMQEDGINSFCVVPLTTAVRRLGAMAFASLKKEAYGEADVEFLQQVGKQVAVAVDNVLHYQDLTLDRDRLRLLLEVSESIASHRDLAELFRDLVQRLHRVAHFEHMRLLLHDPERNVMRLHILETPRASELPPCSDLPVDESPGGWVWHTQQPLVIPRVEQETRFPKVTPCMLEMGVKSFCVVPLTTAQRRLGALGFGSLQEAAYDGSDLEFLQQVASQVAVAVDNALAYQQITQLKDKLTREEAYLTQAQRLTGVGSWAWDPSESHNYYSREVFNIFGLDPTKGNPTLADFRRIYHPEDREFIEEAENKLVSEGQGYDVKYRIVRPDGELRFVREVGTPVRENGVVTGFVGACMDVTDQEQMTQELRREKLYLEDEIRTEYNFEEIIGESATLKRVLKQVETVAPTDSTVLIQGETGTGKELIARAIHHLSKRRERTFVKMNCAAIPTGLLESELFGHERGAFTGAIAQKVGRFELAHGGTLFLDEVGDVPLELQSKLLRVLQEQEFERLGSNRTIRVDVRLVAATNRDLAQMVGDKQFRSDLYYRFNVFPITAPSLRERPEDIPVLVRYFAQKYARLMNRRIETIPAGAMTALAKYHWPGNIRELENLIERSVILSQGPDLHVPLGELKAPAAAAPNGAATLEAAEREHILRVLRETNWVIGGSSGAATRLAMKRTTLQSKMRKLGISRDRR